MRKDNKDLNEIIEHLNDSRGVEPCGATRVLGAAYQSCAKGDGHEGPHQSSSGDTWVVEKAA